MTGAVIGLDWGSSRLRAYLIDPGGRVLQRRSSDRGAIGLTGPEFDAVLRATVGDWAAADPRARLVACGMVGARGGWVEAGYVDLPAGVDAIRGRLAYVGTSLGMQLAIVAGLRTAEPDVIRGEETQALGVGLADGVLCMPGTHSKWLRIRAGTIESFRTWFTGELFELLGGHGSLAKAMGPPTPIDPSAFDAGVAASADPGGWLHQLFGFRARVVGGGSSGPIERSRLSGWLIGSELRQAFGSADFRADAAPLVLVAEPTLAALYERAIAIVAGDALPGVRRADPDCAAHGLFRIASSS
jgi:2-dehydro-3-deoxygalactonokinase